MQRPLLCLGAAALLFLAACHDPSRTASSVASETDSAGRMHSYDMADFDFSRFEGIYSGDFGGTGDIRIAIRHAGGRHAVGYSLHKGLRRNISGSMTPAGDGFDFRLAEPGDNPYDGVFEFHVDTGRFALKGRWTPAGNDKLSPKNFALSKQVNDSTDEDGEFAYSDSLGNLTIHANGLCTYDYYNRRDGREVGQLNVFNGNWRQEGDQVFIDWQPNSVFPSRESTFRLLREEGTENDNPLRATNGYGVYLKGGGREFHMDEI